MKAVLKLEAIGDNLYSYQRLRDKGEAEERNIQTKKANRFATKQGRPWVAHITGLDDTYGFQREFVRSQQKDYSLANSVGSRGVFLYYALNPGIYEINERVTWQKTRRYFIRVKGMIITEITREEAAACLTSTISESTSSKPLDNG